jgi:hypothetical protein
VTQYGVGIGLGHGNRRYLLVFKIQNITVAFLSEHADLADVYNVFSMTAYKRASFEALFYCF